jgi:hypothetical protein
VQPSSDADFKQFVTMGYGYRAIFALLHSYAQRHGLRTIRAMLNRYAPPTENFTEGYIRFVAKCSGIDANRPLDTRSRDDMIPIVAAISEIENGLKARLDEVEEGWRLFSL